MNSEGDKCCIEGHKASSSTSETITSKLIPAFFNNVARAGELDAKITRIRYRGRALSRQEFGNGLRIIRPGLDQDELGEVVFDSLDFVAARNTARIAANSSAVALPRTTFSFKSVIVEYFHVCALA